MNYNETKYAGLNSNNTYYYLYNSNTSNWWLSTSSSFNTTTNDDGTVNGWYPNVGCGTLSYDLQGLLTASTIDSSPSINIKANVLINSGNGTKENPYILKLK